MRKVVFWITVFALHLLISSCGSDDDGSSCVTEGDTNGSILIDIACGDDLLQPTYVWDPDKPAFLVEVRRRTTGQLAWSIGGTDNIIVPPLEHGDVPFGAVVSGNETQLVAEVEYIVKVTRFLDSGLTTESGSREFTLLP